MLDKTIYRQTMDLALEVVFMFDKEGTIVYANKTAEELLQYHDGVVGKSVIDVFPLAFSYNGKLVWNIAKDNEKKQLMAYRGNRTCFEVEARIAECNFDSELDICVALNVSKQTYYERKADHASQQLESAEQVKSQFVANVTHELRTPVNGILGNTQELLSTVTDPVILKKLNLIERGCNDMHSLINNILDFSKLEAGKFVLEKEKFNFRDMIEYVKANHINKITEKGLNFFITISPDVPEYVVGDELRVKQILNNLLSNATKFTSAGRVALEVLKTAQIDGRVELFFMVVDSGIGIAAEDMDKLFKSFSQVEASTTRKYGGTGLGLNISKQLVELMDGSIHVESEVNKGTIFSFHAWFDLDENDNTNTDNNIGATRFDVNIPSLSDMSDIDAIMRYGTQENKEEIEKKLNKLILCVEMENWEKAEMFMESIRQITQDAPQEVKSKILRLKMSVQKADYDKTITAYNNFKELL